MTGPASAHPTPQPRRTATVWRERLLLVGLGACDPTVADRLIAEGRMPVLGRLKAEGTSAPLVAEDPLLPPPLWTTLATGRRPEHHGVLIFYQPRPDGGGVAPIGRDAWQAPSVWQMLEAAGRRTITVGWPATWPATDWPGVHVDTRFALATGPDFETWAMPPGCVSPLALRDRLRDMRVHPSDVTGAMLAGFVPRLRDVDQYRDARLTQIATALASTSTMHAAATGLIVSQDWDVATVHYDLLERIHARFDSVRTLDPWQGVVDAAYTVIDQMVGRLIELAGPETTVWVVSPYGVQRDAASRGTASWRPTGFLAARGRWIEPARVLPPVRLLDMAPSLLARFGLTAPADGRVLTALAPGGTRRPIPVPARPPVQADRHVAALRARDYNDTPSTAQASAMAVAEDARLLALAEALIARGHPREAEAQLVRIGPDTVRSNPTVLRRRALCRLLLADAEGCRTLGAALCEAAPHLGWGDMIVAAGFALQGMASEAEPRMAAACEKGRGDPDLLGRLGGVALMLGQADRAETYFTMAIGLDPDMPAAAHGLALVREQTGSAPPA